MGVSTLLTTNYKTTTKDMNLLDIDNTFYEWVFHHNAHRNTWSAFHRDDQYAYWNNGKFIHRKFEAKDIDTVMQMIKLETPKISKKRNVKSSNRTRK